MTIALGLYNISKFSEQINTRIIKSGLFEQEDRR